jgi:HEAT repeats
MSISALSASAGVALSPRRRSRGAQRCWLGALAAFALLLVPAAASAQSARASASDLRADDKASGTASDRIDQLSALLSKPSSSEKTKLSAVAALGRLGDRRALRPLIDALADASPTVRALAAAALGKLGQVSALPALRQASKDESSGVRARVNEAILAINKANNLEPPASSAAGFGRSSRTTEQSPDLYVVMKSFTDDSPGRSSKKVRVSNAEVVREAMATSLRAAPLVTATASDGKRLHLPPRLVDVSVVKMALRTKGQSLELETELRLAISDENGKMLSFLTGGAKVSVPKRGFNWSYLPQLRKEALENAVRGLFTKLLAHLRSTVA